MTEIFHYALTSNLSRLPVAQESLLKAPREIHHVDRELAAGEPD